MNENKQKEKKLRRQILKVILHVVFSCIFVIYASFRLNSIQLNIQDGVLTCTHQGGEEADGTEENPGSDRPTC